MTTLTFNELILLINQHDNTHQSFTANQKPVATTKPKPKKRIGLMPIDKRVYELLDEPIDELFE